MALFSLLNSLYTGGIPIREVDLGWSDTEDEDDEEEDEEEEPIEGDLSTDDYQKFCAKWLLFVPDGSNFIPLEKMQDFLEALDPPFTFNKPNKYKIATLDFTICKGDVIYRKDVYDELVRDYCIRSGLPAEETVAYNNSIVNILSSIRLGWRPVSSTLWRQKEHYCARMIQHAWRNYKEGLGIGKEEYRCRYKCICALPKTENQGIKRIE